VPPRVALAPELADRVAAEPGFALAAPASLALVCLRMETGDPESDQPG
jgi:glutamate/tyrosine decarboxylase-like PLP-dependent enzyme